MDELTDFETFRSIMLLPFKLDPGEFVEISRGEVAVALTFAKQLQSRAEAAEATVRHLAASTSALLARAEAAEAECVRLREQVADLTALWQRAIDADLLDDPHELETAIVKAAAWLNYPRTLDDD